MPILYRKGNTKTPRRVQLTLLVPISVALTAGFIYKLDSIFDLYSLSSV
jgi:invasion protein IalB